MTRTSKLILALGLAVMLAWAERRRYEAESTASVQRGTLLALREARVREAAIRDQVTALHTSAVMTCGDRIVTVGPAGLTVGPGVWVCDASAACLTFASTVREMLLRERLPDGVSRGSLRRLP